MIRFERFFMMAINAHFYLVMLAARATMRDRLVTTFFPTGSFRDVAEAPLHLFTTIAIADAARQSRSEHQYEDAPEACDHLNLRSYNARRPTTRTDATGAYRICDRCGARWVKLVSGTWTAITPRASPTHSPAPSVEEPTR